MSSTQDQAERATAVLRRAIRDEIAGQRFYLDASFACIDPWAKDIFASLATDEERHAALLLLEHEALLTRGHWIDPELATSSGMETDITRIAFPDEDRFSDLFPAPGDPEAEVDRRSNDLDALALGLDMERQAIELYRQARASTQDSAAKKAYQFLIEEERGHYQQLKDHWEQLAGIPYE